MSGPFKLLTLDVGITTGYAILTLNNLLEHGTIADTCIEEALTELVRTHKSISDVVVERTLPGRSRIKQRCREVERVIDRMFPQAAWIEATVWKSSPSRRHPCPRGLTQHERDAIRIAHWYINGPWEARQCA